MNYSHSIQVHAAGHWRDYYRLTKPKVVALLVMTAWVGMMLARPEVPALSTLFFASLGIAFLSAAAAAFNHIFDQQLDAQMARTHMRPLPAGRLTQRQATVFASTLGCLGFLMLITTVNALTAWLTLAGLLGYALIYTRFLKRATPQNIVIGGIAGALPPLLGWTAVTGQIHSHALVLVMIIFTWTPPHFWALAIHRRDEYAKAKIPMLPVTHGIELTKSLILFYTLLLFLVCLLPFLSGMSGWVYLVGASCLNGQFIYYAWQLKFSANQHSAIRMFHFSVVHLLALFLILLFDHFWLTHFVN